jgi:drug/metabolite transporter (DMT)-like permease
MVTVICWLFLSALFFGVGEYLSKKWSLNPSVLMAGSLILMYVFGTLAWLPAILKGQSLSIVGTLCMTLFIGLALFKEPITTTQIVGICFAFIAIIFLSL